MGPKKRGRTTGLAAKGLAAAALLALTAGMAVAQTPQDVPREHWAYEAVNDLAGKGLVKGYPPTANFLGKRTMTRFEMAAIVQRILTRVDELLEKKADRGDIKPAPAAGVSQEKLDELRRLVDEYKAELVIIGADLVKVKELVGDLSQKTAEAQRSADEAKIAAGKAGADAAAAGKAAEQARADAKSAKDAAAANDKRITLLANEEKQHRIGGYIQARFDSFDSGRSSLFTNTGAGGTGQTPSNGGPSVGGPFYGYQIRRARLKASGPITQETFYQIQIDAPSTGAVSLIDAYVDRKNVLAKNVTARFGQFPPAFGYELFVPEREADSPERAFGFGVSASDYPMFKTAQNATGGVVTPGAVLPLFLNQNRDVGAQLTWTAPGKSATKVLFSVIDGEGRAPTGVRNNNNGVDAIARAETSFLNKKATLGLSGYYGTLAVRGGPPAGSPAAPVPFTQAYRILGGADAHWVSPWKTDFRAEYVGGVFETTPDRAQYLQGNHAQAWYASVRHPLTKKLEFVAKYDEFMPISQVGKMAGGLSRMELIRKTLSGGLLYQLDEATRFRLWYAKALTPYDPSATTGSLRSRLGLITGEIQVVFQ